jgi:post-segregation antitoxin (ccd killing protein)
MARTEPTTISMPLGLRGKAHEHGLCISRVASNAIRDAVEKLEKEVGESRQASAPTAAHKERHHEI